MRNRRSDGLPQSRSTMECNDSLSVKMAKPGRREWDSISLAATAGAAFPLLFNRLGWDPALMSTPFITTCTDVVGTLIYLKTAQWLLLNMPQLLASAGISTQLLAAAHF